MPYLSIGRRLVATSDGECLDCLFTVKVVAQQVFDLPASECLRQMRLMFSLHFSLSLSLQSSHVAWHYMPVCARACIRRVHYSTFYPEKHALSHMVCFEFMQGSRQCIVRRKLIDLCSFAVKHEQENLSKYCYHAAAGEKRKYRTGEMMNTYSAIVLLFVLFSHRRDGNGWSDFGHCQVRFSFSLIYTPPGRLRINR